VEISGSWPKSAFLAFGAIGSYPFPGQRFHI
jgi:hypothetical protein